MKRFMIYLVVIIGMLFVGLTVYYFARNNEVITLTVAQSEIIKINIGDSIEVPINHTRKKNDTKITYTSSDEEVASYDETLNKIVAHTGGSVTFTIETTNEKYKQFIFNIQVGNGTKLNPFFISSASMLGSIGKTETWSLNKNYMLIKDIDLTGHIWTPIGTGDEPFNGSFNGFLHKIIGLKVGGFENAGLFGYISETGRIENVVFDNATIQNETIENANMGVVAGVNEGIISKCFINNSNISSSLSGNFGGIVGKLTRKDTRPYIDMCEVSNIIIKSTSGTGGNIGGLVGLSEAGIIYNSKVKVTIETSSGNSGGVVGEASAKTVDETERYPVVKNCIVFPIIINAGTYKGYIVGKTVTGDEVFYINNYSTSGSLSSAGNSPSLVAGSVLNLTEMVEKSSFISWNFDYVWEIGNDGPYIIIDGQSEALQIYEDGEYITEAGVLLDAIDRIRDSKTNSNKSYIINDNIVLDFTDVESFKPIGSESVPFTGAFVVSEGKTLTVKNLTLNSSESNLNYLGFFGYVKGNAEISGITLENIIINAGPRDFVGGIVGFIESGTLSNITINNLTINNGSFVGGAVGYSNTKLQNIKVNSANITINNTELITCGGVLGFNTTSGVVDKCEAHTVEFNLMSSSKEVKVGGVCGENHGVVKNSFRFGGIMQASTENKYTYAGGVVGYNNNLISLCYNSSASITTNINSNAYAGGLVGFTGDKSRIEDSFVPSGNINGYYVGGLGGSLNGTVQYCYSKASVEGKNAGGFAYQLYGQIYDSYTLSNLTSDSGKMAGFVIDLPRGAVIERCYTGVKMNGEGHQYAECEARTRSVSYEVANILSNKAQSGKVVKSLVNTVGMKGLSKTENFFDSIGLKGVLNKEFAFHNKQIIDNLLTQSDINYLRDLGFGSKWNLETQKLPELIGLDINEIYQNESLFE